MDTPPIQPLSESGKAPKSRIKSAEAAYTLFGNLKTNDQTAALYRFAIQGLVDGNPPYSSSALKRDGQSWRCNVNWREAESIIDTNTASIWELDFEVPNLIAAKTSYQDPQRPGINHAAIIEEEYTRAIRRWPSYYFNRMTSIKEMLVTGIGPMYWRDKYDWRPYTAKRSALLIEPTSKADVSEMELIGFRHSYQPHELYQKIKDDEAKQTSKDDGWNTTLLLDVIQRSAKNPGATSESKYQSTEQEAMQQDLKNNDLVGSQNNCNPIRVIQFLIKEYNGKVSRYIIYEDQQYADFLFKGIDEFDGMEQAVCLFMWNVGDGYCKSIKGLGHRIFPHVEQSNRFICSTVDSAVMSSSFILQPSDAGSRGQINLMRLGPITILPKGYSAIQQSFSPKMEGLIDVRSMLYNILNNNTNVFKKQAEDPNAPERTLGEVQIQAMNTAKLDKNQISIHYLHLDGFHKEIYRRLSNSTYPKEAGGYAEAKKFQDDCVKRGVPLKVLQEATVSATRAIGYGSATMREIVTNQLMALAPGMDEIGRRNVLRDKVAALVGYDTVDRYVPEAGRDQIPTSEHSLAVLENNDIMEGAQVLVGVDQPHTIHLLVHMPLIGNIAQAYMEKPESINLAKAVPAFGIGLQHCRAHLQALAQDPTRKGEVEKIGKQLDPLEKVFASMQKALEFQQKQQQQQQAEQQQQVQKAQGIIQDRDFEIKAAEMDKKMELKMQDMLMRNKMKEQKSAHDMNLEDIKTAADIKRANTKQAAAPAEQK